MRVLFEEDDDERHHTLLAIHLTCTTTYLQIPMNDLPLMQIRNSIQQTTKYLTCPNFTQLNTPIHNPIK